MYDGLTLKGGIGWWRMFVTEVSLKSGVILVIQITLRIQIMSVIRIILVIRITLRIQIMLVTRIQITLEIRVLWDLELSKIRCQTSRGWRHRCR